jgi:hypothetical protein
LQMKVRRLADKLRPPPTQQPADAEPPQPPIPSEGASTDDAAAASATVSDVQAADVASGQAAVAIASLNAEAAAPPKKICKTSAQAQQDWINERDMRDKKVKARKMATCLHQQEMQNKAEGKPYM